MVTKICKRSGLEFKTDNNRLTVHPEISRYTSNKDTEIRYPAIAVIERGKAEGWKTIEQFEGEIQKALNPAPQPIDQIKEDFEGDWVALIKGFSERYGYDRDFLDSVGERGRFKLFQYPETGIVETCYVSAKGNKTKYFRLIEAGKEVRVLTAGEVDAFLGGRPQVSDQLAATDCWKVESAKSLGTVGETIQIDGAWAVIVTIDCETTYHDEDGISHRGRYPRNVEVIYETYEYKTTVRPATEQEITTKSQELSVKAAAKLAYQRFQEIARLPQQKPLVASPSPTNCIKIAYNYKALEYDRPYLLIDPDQQTIWHVQYNGRDGDLWDLNNGSGGTSIWTEQPLTPEIEAELSPLVASIQALYPDAIKHL